MPTAAIETDSLDSIFGDETPDLARSTPNQTSWISGFLDHTAHLPSPEIFRRWSAIAAVGAAAERRCWTSLRGMPPLYCNMFVLLVAHPGVGKSVSVNAATHFWRCTHNLHIAPATMTKAALVDALKEAKQSIDGGPLGRMEFHSLQIPATEFGNLVPAYDLAMVNVLNDLFDCRDDFIERTRGGGEINIPFPQISILGATQPDYLSAMMPEAAWGMGFTSRIIMVYSDDRSSSTKSLFAFVNPSPEDHKVLAASITKITKMKGEFQWEPEAAQLLDQWHIAGGPPAPNAPRLNHYVTRRTIHLVKLMMIAALARHSMVIGPEDFNDALDWLLEAETTMPEIFRAMVMGGDSAILTDAALWAIEQEAKAGPIPRAKLVDFLRTRMKSGDVLKALEIMVFSNMIRQCAMDGVGIPIYTTNIEPPAPTRAPKPKASPQPDLFSKTPSPPPSEARSARYIFLVPSDTEEEERYDEDFYNSHV